MQLDQEQFPSSNSPEMDELHSTTGSKKYLKIHRRQSYGFRMLLLSAFLGFEVEWVRGHDVTLALQIAHSVGFIFPLGFFFFGTYLVIISTGSVFDTRDYDDLPAPLVDARRHLRRVSS